MLLAPCLCHGSSSQGPTVERLLAANKTVNELKATAHAFLRVTPIQPDEAIWRLIADASLANIENKSQGGFHLALVHQSILDGASGTSSTNSWKSHKLKRVVKATLGSEALAMDDALAEVEWLRALWNEVLNPASN